MSNLYRGVLNTLPYKSSFGLHIYGNVYRGPISYHISRKPNIHLCSVFLWWDLWPHERQQTKSCRKFGPMWFAPLQVWRWCNGIKWAACMQIIYAARQSNSESQARYRVHVPKEALHFPLSVPRIWIYSSESRANNRLSAQVYLSRCCCWCGGCVPKIVPAPISEHVLFKFNEKEAARLCDKFRIRWRERDEAIFALERKRLLIHATFCSPPLFVCAGAHRKRETARRAKLCDRAQRAALLQLIPPVYILFCFRKVGRRTNHANCCSFLSPLSKPLTGVKFGLNPWARFL